MPKNIIECRFIDLCANVRFFGGAPINVSLHHWSPFPCEMILKNSQDFLRIIEKACENIKFSEIPENFSMTRLNQNLTPSRTSRGLSRILENNDFQFDKVIQGNSRELWSCCRLSTPYTSQCN